LLLNSSFHLQGSTSAKSQRNRKRPKRYIEDDEGPEPERKVARTSTAGKARKQSTAEPEPNDEDPAPSADVEVDVVMNDATDEAEKDAEDYHSEHSSERNVSSAEAQSKATKSKGKARVPAPPAKKKIQKRNVVVSESEDEDDYMDVAVDVVAEDEDDEDYYSPEEKSTKAFKGKAKASSAKSTTGKRKAKAEPSETGRSGSDKKSGGLSATTKKKPKVLPKHEEIPVDIVGESAADGSANIERPSPATTKQDSPMPTVAPKKPKLPTIKKTKLPSAPGVNTPLSATSSTSKLPLELGLNTKLNHDGIRKTLINKTDVDLSDKSVYQELFSKMVCSYTFVLLHFSLISFGSQAGEGGTPRRTKEDERRRELNRMREEFKAKRTEEAVRGPYYCSYRLDMLMTNHSDILLICKPNMTRSRALKIS
jgi:hypothetical protein